jgi:hypothetical protein
LGRLRKGVRRCRSFLKGEDMTLIRRNATVEAIEIDLSRDRQFGWPFGEAY